MATSTYPLMQRVTDIAVVDSPALAILGPRSFSAAELLALAREIRALEAMLSMLAMYIIEHKTSSDLPSDEHTDYITYNILATESTASIDIAGLALVGCEMIQASTNTAVADSRVGTSGPYSLSYDSVVLATFNVSSYVAHAFLKYVPAEVYHAVGSMLEELAAAYYKGNGPSAAITAAERVSFIRLQDKVTKTLIEQASQTAIGSNLGLLSGADAYAGRALARQNSELIVRNLAPNIGAWLYDEIPLGVRAYNPVDA